VPSACGGRYATLRNLHILMENTADKGRDFVVALSKICFSTPEKAEESADVVSRFLNDFYSENSATYKQLAPVSARLALLNMSLWGHMLNPDYDKGERGIIIEEDDVVEFKDNLLEISMSNIEVDLFKLLQNVYGISDLNTSMMEMRLKT